MKKIMLAVLLLVMGLFTWGFSNGDHGKSVEQILAGIRQTQGIKAEDKIKIEKVTEKELEELGDAVMSLRHPDPKEHEWMDQRMGGEGSESLKAAHKMMGYRYLQYLNGEGYGGYGPGMMNYGGGRGYGMGPGMMGNGRRGYGPMGYGSGYMDDGRPFFHRYGFWFGGWFWLIIILVVGSVIFLVVHKRKAGTPLEIAKTRYAKGEISKEEFEQLKKDL